MYERGLTSLKIFIGDKMEWIFIDGKQLPLEEYIEIYGDIDDD